MSNPSLHGESGQSFLFRNKLETLRFNALLASGANVPAVVDDAVGAAGATAEVTASITEAANTSASLVLVSVFFISSLTAAERAALNFFKRAVLQLLPLWWRLSPAFRCALKALLPSDERIHVACSARCSWVSLAYSAGACQRRSTPVFPLPDWTLIEDTPAVLPLVWCSRGSFLRCKNTGSTGNKN